MYVGVIRYLNGKKARKLSLLEAWVALGGGWQARNKPFLGQSTLILSTVRGLASLCPKTANPYVGHWHDLVLGVTAGQLLHFRGITVTFLARLEEGAITPRGRIYPQVQLRQSLTGRGSRGMYGAALLAGRASFTTGVGHLTVHIPQKGQKLVLQIVFARSISTP